MARFFIFAAVLATFSANAGASWFSRTAAVKADNDVRERRATEDKQVLYCNSMGCPSGYTPIDNAKDVECEDDPCEVSQCCEAFCSYHPCPNNCTPVTDAATILCDDSGCTTDLCCDCVDEIPPLYCNSIACPDSCNLPIDNAKEVECDNDPCEVTQCCQSFCSSHVCPNNCTHVDDASLIVCDACECTTDRCCNCATDDSNDDGVDTQYCDSVTCSFENDLIENAEQVACDYDPCREMQCCEAVCAYIPCPTFCTGGEPTTLCEPSGCTLDLCCNCAN